MQYSYNQTTRRDKMNTYSHVIQQPNQYLPGLPNQQQEHQVHEPTNQSRRELRFSHGIVSILPSLHFAASAHAGMPKGFQDVVF